MRIVFYVVIGFFALFGMGTLFAASQTKFKNLGLFLGAVCYIGAAFAAYYFSSWLPFLIGFVLSWGVRLLGGDPSK